MAFLVLAVSAAAQQPAWREYGRLPLVFEPNQGQADTAVKVLARLPGQTLFVTSDEAVLAGHTGSVERMKLVGANRKRRIELLDKQQSISNYFIGNDPSKWRTNVPNYGRVTLREVYDWVVAPGADPEQIRMKWKGKDAITRNESGDLVLSASLRQTKPVILQEGKPIDGGYVVRGKEVGFEVAKYDSTKPLVIDPVLVYSTYLGGTMTDEGLAISVVGRLTLM